MNKKPNKKWLYLGIGLVILLVINFASFSSLFSGSKSNTVEYSEFIRMLVNGEIHQVEIGSKDILFSKSNSIENIWTRDDCYVTTRVDDDNLVERLIENQIDFHAADEGSALSFFDILIGIVLPAAFYGFMIFWLIRMIRGAKNGGSGGIGGGMFSFGKSSAKMYEAKDINKHFVDVAGQDEAKEELVELVDFLHNPERYKSMGAKLPKGALLVGPPGTGKTLLAQAVAGEAKVPFFFVSGSAFVEMFVGTGAARVRDLFKQASEKAPCIVFIDEIDAIGKRRDTVGISGNDEREQTLNQLLAEMDGFDPSKGIIVLAATNRPEILDKALLRPGRFDRRITVDLPDLKGREAILKVHAKNITADASVNLNAIARATVGASGADLANIINEGALRAVRTGHTAVTQADLDAAVEQVIAGSERKSLVISQEEKRYVAYHEIGHALVAALQKHSAPIHKITIVPRTTGALGFTMQTEESDRFLMSRDELFAKLTVLTAGRAAEEFVFNSCTTGASNDIEQATKLARMMITRYGMSQKFGMVALDGNTAMYLDGENHPTCSQETSTRIDYEIQEIINQAYAKAKLLIQDNAQVLNALATTLLERETMSGEEFMELLNAATTPEFC